MGWGEKGGGREMREGKKEDILGTFLLTPNSKTAPDKISAIVITYANI
jgi:hypothetical protein